MKEAMLMMLFLYHILIGCVIYYGFRIGAEINISAFSKMLMITGVVGVCIVYRIMKDKEGG